jgi:tetratricopeptide (TPR) repeat protein
LVDALDDWAVTLRPGPRLNWVLGVARLADPDAWRDRVRNAKVWTNRAALSRLAQQALARLAEGAPNGRVPSRFVGFLALRLYWLRGDAEALLRAAQRRLPGDFWVNFQLGNALYAQKRVAEAIGFFRAALAVRPDAPPVHNNLGNALKTQGRRGEAMGEYRRAIALDPKLPQAHYNLGNALSDQGHLRAAVAEYRRAIALDPKDPDAHTGLGNALHNQGKLSAAVTEYHRAIALDPKKAKPHIHLGIALYAQGQLGAALAEYRRAIALDPKLPEAHYNLGNALRQHAKPAEAVRAFRKAIALKPDYAEAYTNLGNALDVQGKLAGAVQAHLKAIALKPNLALVHNNLGAALHAQGKLADAVQAYRKAIALQPDFAQAHYNLGDALRQQGILAEAAQAYKKSIDLQPHVAEAHCNLGHTLLKLGDLAGALSSLKRGHQLGKQKRVWRYPSARWVRDAERLVRLNAKLSQVLAGTVQPASGKERIALAALCQKPFKQRYAAAARLYREAFTADPNLVEDLRTGARYQAACAAALGGCGRGKDVPIPNAQERARLRSEALAWLQADLVRWQKQLRDDRVTGKTRLRGEMAHWVRDPDLAGVRDEKTLAGLPPAERRDWQQLWAEVRRLAN